MLGIPTDVVDATEHLLGLAHDWHPRRVDVGRVNERYFLFSAGVGLDASVVKRVDAHPRLKARVGEYYYAWTATHTVHRHYVVHPPRLEAELDGETVPGVTAIVQNAEPYTYFGNRPVHMGEGATLDSGDLAGVVLQRASPIDIPTITWRALSKRARLVKHRRVHGFRGRRIAAGALRRRAPPAPAGRRRLHRRRAGGRFLRPARRHARHRLMRRSGRLTRTRNRCNPAAT